MNAGHVYVLGFSNGTVKVGKTQNAGQRMNAHRSDGRKFGLTVTDEWVSPLHAEWNANEDALKKITTGLGGTTQRAEYFNGVSFAAVAGRARELPFTPLRNPGGGEESPWLAPMGLNAYQHYRLGEWLLSEAHQITVGKGGPSAEAAQKIADAHAHMTAAVAHAAIFGADPGQFEHHKGDVLLAASMGVDEGRALRLMEIRGQQCIDVAPMRPAPELDALLASAAQTGATS